MAFCGLAYLQMLPEWAYKQSQSHNQLSKLVILLKIKTIVQLRMTTSSPQAIDIDYVANLARITLTEEEKSLFTEQLGDILKYMEKLQSVDVTDVEPMAHAFSVYNVWREDEPQPSLSPEDALQNAPAQRDRQIVVPKVVE